MYRNQFVKYALLVVLLNCFIGSATLKSQTDLAFDFFTVNQGLSDRQITELHLDNEGFVWVGTRDGLNRFDGYNFLPFGQGPYSTGGLSLGEIEHIGRDLEGKFAIFYHDFYGYFDRFDPETFKTEQVEIVPSNGVEGFPRALAIDKLGRIFTATISREETTIYEYTPTGFTEVIRLQEKRKSIATPLLLKPLRNGQFLLYDGTFGLRHLNARGELLRRIPLQGMEAGPVYGEGNFERINFLEEGSDRNIYFSFFGLKGLYRWKVGGNTIPELVTEVATEHYYQQLFKDGKGQLLVSSRTTPGPAEQVQHFHLINRQNKFVPFDNLLEAGSRVYTVASENFNDKIFMGLYDGLGLVERRKQQLTNYLAVDQEEEYIQNNIQGICEDRSGNLYFIEAKGQLYSKAPDKNYMDSVPMLLVSEQGELLELEDAKAIIYVAEDGAIWGIGQQAGRRNIGMLFRYDLNTSYTTAFYAPDFYFNAIALAYDGSIFLAARHPWKGGQLLQFDRASEFFTSVRNEQGQDFLRETEPLCLTTSKKGDLLIGTENRGLFIYDPLTEQVNTYSPPEPSNKKSVVFNNYTIYVIHEDQDRNLWLGTRGGLHKFNPKTEEVTYFGRKDGLSSNIICGILPDSSGGYWLSTYNGITHLALGKKKAEFRRFYRDDGLSNNEFNHFAYHRTRNGQMYFGGINGITAFYPHELANRFSETNVVLTQISLYGKNGERVLNANLDEIDEVVVQPYEKGIAVQFALPATTRADRNRFRVKMGGLDGNWVELNNEHTARYHNLPAGNYALYIQGADANGNYAERMIRLPIRVKQYIFERTWFQVLMSLLVAGLVIGFLQNRSSERLRSEQLRTQLSSDIHDEVSGLLAGITLQSELLQSYTDDELIRTRLIGVGQAGRKAMSKMSDVIWSIDSRRDTMGDLLQRMQEHADDVLLPVDIRYTFKADGLSDKHRKLPGNKRQELYFIYKEAINNIARHSNATHASIYVTNRGQEFELLVKDNGTPTDGLAAKKSAKSGQGLANLQMRAKRLDATLEVSSQKGYSIRLRMKRFT